MTAPIPHYRVVATDGAMSTVEVDLPDFTKAVITMAGAHIGTPAGDAMIRQVLARHEETKDQLRGEV